MRAFLGRWARSLAVGVFVELVIVAGTVAAPNLHHGRHADALGSGLVLVAGAMVVVARRWPGPALLLSLAATGAYFLLGYAVDTSFFAGLAVTAYRSASTGARGRGAAFVLVVLLVFGGSALVPRSANGADWLWVAVILVGAQIAGQVSAELAARAAREAAAAREEESRRRVAEEGLRTAREVLEAAARAMAVIDAQAGAAAKVMERHPGQARQALETIRATSRGSTGDLLSTLGRIGERDEPEPIAAPPGPAGEGRRRSPRRLRQTGSMSREESELRADVAREPKRADQEPPVPETLEPQEPPGTERGNAQYDENSLRETGLKDD